MSSEQTIDDTPTWVGPYLIVPKFLAKNYHGQLAELHAEADRLQPPWPDEFSQQAAAVHEASHCVMAAREGFAMKSASVTKLHNGSWIGENRLEASNDKIPIAIDLTSKTSNEPLLAQLRIIIAGRRGELLFEKHFCLRAGLDELAYAHIMIMPVVAAMRDGDEMQMYRRLWGSQLAEVDETLLAYRPVIRGIANQLMGRGTLRSKKLKAALAPVVKRMAAPPIRDIAALNVTDADPLA